ncbi:MAG: hypothetical protein PHX78_11960 [bacterium]|nr:hypothetical protein [bacterium]
MSKRCNEHGAIVSLVLMIMFGLFLLATAVMVLRATDFKISYAERDLKRAIYTAEAGIERAAYTLNSDSDWSDSTPVSSLYTNETLSYSAGGDVPYTGTYTVTLSNRGKDDIEITSVGTVNNSTRKVMVRMTR